MNDTHRLGLIGVLGGTSWPSTIPLYRLLNEEVARRLGEKHSARIALYSIDYHDIRACYSHDWAPINGMLLHEIRTLLSFRPDCWMIANNTLHKIYDEVGGELPADPPMIHAVHQVREELLRRELSTVLLLGTRFTMEDGYYADPLRAAGISVAISAVRDRERIGQIQSRLADGHIDSDMPCYFSDLIERHAAAGCKAVVLGCTELPLVITDADSPISVIDPLVLQARACVEVALRGFSAPGATP